MMRIQKNIIVEGNEGYKKSLKFYENDNAFTCKKS